MAKKEKAQTQLPTKAFGLKVPKPPDIPQELQAIILQLEKDLAFCHPALRQGRAGDPLKRPVPF
jgi:hypothetical protein